MSVEKRLKELGVTLPSAALPVAAYVPVVRTGNLVFVSGQLPMKDGKLVCEGRVDKDVSLEKGYEAARLCAINALSALKAEIGSLDLVERIVRVTGFVQSSDDFHKQPQVVNGASEFLAEVFADKGQHSRVAVGANSLPLNTPVEVSMIVEVANL